jgi:hypothetical protein
MSLWYVKARLYRWLDERGSIPWIVWKLWPEAHYCSEMDGLLCVPWDLSRESCFCGRIDQTERDARWQQWQHAHGDGGDPF